MLRLFAGSGTEEETLGEERSHAPDNANPSTASLPKNVKRCNKKPGKFFVAFSVKTTKGKQVSFWSPESSNLELVTLWAAHLQELRADVSLSPSEIRDRMFQYTRSSKDAEDPDPYERDLPLNAQRSKNDVSCFLKYAYKDAAGKKREWRSPAVRSPDLLRAWSEELQKLKADKAMKGEEVAQRISTYVGASKQESEPSALPRHIRRQGLTYYLSYQQMRPGKQNVRLGTTVSVQDPGLACELSTYFQATVKPLGKAVCERWLKEEIEEEGDAALTPWRSFVDRDVAPYVQRNGEEISQVVFLEGCVPDDADNAVLLSGIMYLKIADHIRKFGFSLLRTRMRKCRCRESGAAAASSSGVELPSGPAPKRVGLCKSLTADDKREGALVLSRALDLDVAGLQEGLSVVGSHDEMKHESARTLYVFCGALSAGCVTDALHSRVQGLNYIYAHKRHAWHARKKSRVSPKSSRPLVWRAMSASSRGRSLRAVRQQGSPKRLERVPRRTLRRAKRTALA